MMWNLLSLLYHNTNHMARLTSELLTNWISLSNVRLYQQYVHFSIRYAAAVAMVIEMADTLRPLATLVSSSVSPDTVGSYRSLESNRGKRTMTRAESVGSTFGNPSDISAQADAPSFWNCETNHKVVDNRCCDLTLSRETLSREKLSRETQIHQTNHCWMLSK